MEAIKVAIRAALPSDLEVITHRHLRDLLAKVAHRHLIKECSKVITKILAPFKIILKNNTLDHRVVECRSRESSINRTHLGRIIRLTYPILKGLFQIGDTLGVTCRRTVPEVRTCTIGMLAINSRVVIQLELHPVLAPTITQRRLRVIRRMHNNRHPRVNHLHRHNHPLRRHIPVLKITTDKNRVDMELQVEVKFTLRQQQLIKICRHLHQVLSNQGDIQTLPKTSSILSIISNGRPIQDGQARQISITVALQELEFSILVSNLNRSHNNHNHHRHSLRLLLVLLLPLVLQAFLALSNGSANSQPGPRPNLVSPSLTRRHFGNVTIPVSRQLCIHLRAHIRVNLA